MQMKEEAVTDSGKRRQGRSGGMEARRGTEAGNPAGVPSTTAGSQRGEGRHSCRHTGPKT